MCVTFQFANESSFFYHYVSAVREVSFQYNVFKVRDLVVRFFKCLATEKNEMKMCDFYVLFLRKAHSIEHPS